MQLLKNEWLGCYSPEIVERACRCINVVFVSQKPCEDRSKDYEIGLAAFFHANAYYVESNYVYAQGAYIRSSSRFKTWSFLKAEFRPQNKNAKSEPRLSGLTLCVPVL